MTVAKQPAVYTFTCNRCATSVASSSADGDNGELQQWRRVDLRDSVAGDAHGTCYDLCAWCVQSFRQFMAECSGAHPVRPTREPQRAAPGAAPAAVVKEPDCTCTPSQVDGSTFLHATDCAIVESRRVSP